MRMLIYEHIVYSIIILLLLRLLFIIKLYIIYYLINLNYIYNIVDDMSYA